jgi:hypothetical protein
VINEYCYWYWVSSSLTYCQGLTVSSCPSAVLTVITDLHSSLHMLYASTPPATLCSNYSFSSCTLCSILFIWFSHIHFILYSEFLLSPLPIHFLHAISPYMFNSSALSSSASSHSSQLHHFASGLVPPPPPQPTQSFYSSSQTLHISAVLNPKLAIQFLSFTSHHLYVG